MISDEDKKLLDVLRADSSRTQKDIARELGITESTLSKKIERLLNDDQDNAIQNYSININYEKTGFATHAVSLVRVANQNKGVIENITNNAKTLNEAVEVYSILGRFDIYIRWLADSPQTIYRCVSQLSQAGAEFETLTLGDRYKHEQGPWLTKK